MTIEQRDAETSVIVFVLEVSDRKHLARVVRIVRRMPDVLRVERTMAGVRRPENIRSGHVSQPEEAFRT